jgi:hypothetical protein
MRWRTDDGKWHVGRKGDIVYDDVYDEEGQLVGKFMAGKLTVYYPEFKREIIRTVGHLTFRRIVVPNEEDVGLPPSMRPDAPAAAPDAPVGQTAALDTPVMVSNTAAGGEYPPDGQIRMAAFLRLW